MPRTAPEVDGTPDRVQISWRFIDANGQPASFPLVTTQALATNANIEAMTEALGNMTNANLYGVEVSSVYADTGSAAGATEAPRESAKDVINLLMKDVASLNTQEVEVFAPLDSLFATGTQDVLLDSTEMIALVDAANDLLPVGYQAISARFTERRKQNKRAKF